MPVHIVADTKSMLDIMSKVSHTNEKRIMLDTYITRQANVEHEISNTGLVIISYNLADGPTDRKVQVELAQLLITLYHKPKVEQ